MDNALMSLTRLPDLTELDWIRAGVEALEVAPKQGKRVTHCMPNVFDRYVKVMHPVYRGPADTQGRLLWREVAEVAHLPFTPEIHGANFHNLLPHLHLLGPGEGDMGAETLDRLIQLLAPTVVSQRCFIYWWMIATEDWEDALFTGALSDIPAAAALAGAHFETPSYLWPSNRSWLVCCDWDLTFTLVGADRRLADQLLASPNLETVEVKPGTRIDTRAWPVPKPWT